VSSSAETLPSEIRDFAPSIRLFNARKTDRCQPLSKSRSLTRSRAPVPSKALIRRQLAHSQLGTHSRRGTYTQDKAPRSSVTACHKSTTPTKRLPFNLASQAQNTFTLKIVIAPFNQALKRLVKQDRCQPCQKSPVVAVESVRRRSNYGMQSKSEFVAASLKINRSAAWISVSVP